MISFQDPKLLYTGRIDWSCENTPVWIFPTTSVQFRCDAKKVILTVENHRVCWDNYIGVMIDGKEHVWPLKHEGNTELTLIDENENGIHDIIIFKRQDSCHHLTLKNLELDEMGYLLDAPSKPKRRIEVYGDSVSAGEVSEAIDYLGKEDPVHTGEYSNSWYSYAAITARKLGAELHNIAQGGAPLLDGNGWVEPPVYLGLVSIWDKLSYHPRLGPTKQWDFQYYRPHVVIVAIGQNDAHPDNHMALDYEGIRSRHWRYKYRKFIEDLRAVYPSAVIILTTTLLNHSNEWDQAIEEVTNELEDLNVYHFLYKRNGCGTPGHLRIAEAEEMAEELTGFIESLGPQIWKDEEIIL